MIDTMISDLVTTDGSQTYTTSLVVAERFGRQHKNILQAYDARFMFDDTDEDVADSLIEFDRLNFQPINYTDKQGRSQRVIQMTRDGFAFLAMGLTGQNAAVWKVRFLQAFNQAMSVMTEEIPRLRAELAQNEKTITRLIQERDSAMMALPAPGRKRRSDAGIILTYAFVPGVIPGELLLQPIYKSRDDATEFDMDMHRFKHCATKGPYLLRTASEILRKYNSDPDPLIQQALDIVRSQVPELEE